MATVNVAEFQAKWRRAELSERSASQQHFLDLCALVEHPTPAAADPTGESFTFERGAAKHGGGDGWADVWKKGFFGWEYKGRHKDLDAAYDQLQLYREALENPPLLVVCDMDRLVIRTNFTNTPTQTYELSLDDLGELRSLEILRAVFHDPARLKPGATSQAITAEAASRVAEIAHRLRSRGLDPMAVARFLDRLVFCLFAEDVGLLPDDLFTRITDKASGDPRRFANLVGQLFAAMASGADFGLDTIRHFDGHLFDDVSALELTADELEALHAAAQLDWSAVDPSVFGTLFERGMDPDKRSQLGAHYTSREDIETLVEPVVMTPLRRDWDETRRLADNLLTSGTKHPTGRATSPPAKGRLDKARLEAETLIRHHLLRLAEVRVLDPACGSGNFLYVTLQKLKDLEKEVIVWAMDHHLGGFLPMVGPWQLHGIEVNPYAFELAQMTVWIGYLQWTNANGFGITQTPVLKPMDTFELKDAILDLGDPDHPAEPEWPAVDFIVGNPPFLGNRLARSELGEEYVEGLSTIYRSRSGGLPDLCCYWFEKARASIAEGRCQRAGLLATQSIRGGTNRKVLKRICESGGIFFSESDRPWVLNGANVHISMVGFDDGSEADRELDGEKVRRINANLTAGSDITQAVKLVENAGISFQGAIKRGKFDVDEETARKFLTSSGNPNSRPNSDVVLPYVNGHSILKRKPPRFVVQFPDGTAKHEAAAYEAPFRRALEFVCSARQDAKQAGAQANWWLHWCSRAEMAAAISGLERTLVTPRVAKHRVFVWQTLPAHLDAQVIVITTDDHLMLGTLHSRPHELWARAQGTQLRERESGFRYTPTTCFETFPFPRPTDEQREAIAAAARELDRLRSTWLNPPEWTREEVLEFPGSVDGPWARWLHEPDERGIGAVRWPRVVPCDGECAAKLASRTLTNLYNQRPTWLDLAHRRLDEAVLAAYGWPPDLDDDELLARLLALNLERAAEEPPAFPVTAGAATIPGSRAPELLDEEGAD